MAHFQLRSITTKVNEGILLMIKKHYIMAHELVS